MGQVVTLVQGRCVQLRGMWGKHDETPEIQSILPPSFLLHTSLWSWVLMNFNYFLYFNQTHIFFKLHNWCVFQKVKWSMSGIQYVYSHAIIVSWLIQKSSNYVHTVTNWSNDFCTRWRIVLSMWSHAHQSVNKSLKGCHFYVNMTYFGKAIAYSIGCW